MSIARRLRARRAARTMRRRARVGRGFQCGPDTQIHLEGDPGQITIGDHVALLEAELRCYANGRIAIGDHCWFSLRTQIISCSSVTIGAYCIAGRDVYISDTNEHPVHPETRREQTRAMLEEGRPPDRYEAATSPVTIGDDVWIGERAFIMKGVRIGRGSIVAANSVVTRDIPELTIAAGSPAEPVGTVHPAEHGGAVRPPASG